MSGGDANGTAALSTKSKSNHYSIEGLITMDVKRVIL